ncbi:MAG: hypothetical protein Q8N09_11535 [Thermodesulfovibrionia bacterium]|nr:hypothetical protein [Thermodesulfovibrionia bacterium]
MLKRRFNIFERIYSSHWFLTSYNGPGFVYDFSSMGGGNFITKAFYVMEQGTCRYIFDIDEFEKGAHFTANRLINDNKWRLGIYKRIDFYTKKYFSAGESLRKILMASLTDKEIIKVIRQIIPLQHYHQVH